ncbi:MAG: hypothetical protein Q9204_005446 [Flavoplaca sp. TL-2023a]
MAEYNYTPLNEKAGEIRLLELLPGPFNARICITLKITVLSRQNIPKFKALSYAWGNAQDRVRIHVVAGRGVQGAKSAALNITRSLAEALRHLRKKRQSMVFWIDQICVDQANLEERGNQVLRMPDIFTLAKSVIVWLGPATNDSEVAMKIFNKIGPDITVDWDRHAFQVDSSSNFYFRSLDLSPEQCHSITTLLSRAWFERLAHAYSISQGVLTVTGVCVTVAHEVKKDLPRIVPEDRMESAKVIRCLLTSIAGKDHSGSNLNKLHSLCLNLCAGTFAEKYIPPNQGWLTLKEFNDYHTCLYRCNNSSHEVVGGCYIDGIMDGGALLGELPKDWMYVYKIFPKLGHYVVLLDSETQEIHLHDPRLGPLPAGWRIKKHKNDYAYNWFVNDVTGEKTPYDPRLEPEALKARGVDLREFRLI